ncbi:MAG: hypothetical protein ACJ78J_07995 [Gemmatimonadaceae bacterium]
MRKYCNFCGEPMQADAKECKQCGWDVALNAPPSTDPGDTKARVGVAAGLAVAYGAFWFLVQGVAMPVRAEPPRTLAYAPAPSPELSAAPVSAPPTDIGAPTSGIASAPAASDNSGALITIKIADSKKSSIGAFDALQYLFALPETEQKCRLVGTTKGVGGYARNIEVFLLTDDEYVFWHANPAAIAQSSWETFRGSENILDYALPGAGIYHFIVSNAMSAAPASIAVKAQVKCAR